MTLLNTVAQAISLPFNCQFLGKMLNYPYKQSNSVKSEPCLLGHGGRPVGVIKYTH